MVCTCRKMDAPHSSLVDSSRLRPAFGSPGSFRTPSRQFELHPLERIVTGLVMVLLIFLPWAFGGMKLGAQLIALGLSACAFFVALIPRHYDARHHAGGNVRLIPWPRVVRFPLFWLGLLFLVYVTIQALNPAWRYIHSTKGWWMTHLDFIPWLPSGTDSPFHWGNPWRNLIVFAAVWFMVCALWAGITRRRTLLILLVTLSINAVVLGVVAAAQRVTGTHKILWTYASSNEIWATFFYRNHGAAWFNLMIPIVCGLGAWFQLRGQRNFAKSNPAAVFAFFAILLSVIVAVSYSRGGVLSLILFLALFLLAYLIRQWLLPSNPHRLVVVAVMVILFAGFSYLGLRQLDAQGTRTRLESLFNDDNTTLTVRQTATRATFDMWRDKPWLGHGAGSFRFVFPKYQQHYPLIYTGGRQRLLWDFAHNDLAQTLAEYGVVGGLILLAMLAWGGWQFLRQKAWSNYVSLSLLLGLLAAVFHSWGEFIFQCPAILFTWAALFVIMVRWPELDPSNRS